MSTERQIGFAEGPIPVSAIERFALDAGMDDVDEIERFTTLIRAMDGAHLSRGDAARPAGKGQPTGRVALDDREGMLALIRRIGGAKSVS